MTKTKQPTIIITGAGGYLGTELARYCVSIGWKVIGLVRDPKRYAMPGVTYRAYDLAQDLDDKILQGADYLVHTAYVKYDRSHPDALDVNVRGAKQLIEAARKQRIKHSLFMSTMSAHEGGTSVYSQQKLQIEQLFTGKHDTVFSSGLIIGNGGIVKQMASFMQTKRIVPLIGGGKQPLQVIAVYDLVRLIVKVLEEGISGRYVSVNPTIYSYKDFYVQLGKRLGIRPLFVPLPLGLLQFVLRLADRLGVTLSINEENVSGLKHLVAVDTTKDLQKLGVTLDDLPTALAKTTTITS